MNSLTELVFAAALALGLVSGDVANQTASNSDPKELNARWGEPGAVGAPLTDVDRSRLPFSAVSEYVYPKRAQQVRIERRVIVRIAPQRGAVMPTTLAPMPNQRRVTPAPPVRMTEKKHADCVKIGDISGARPGADRRLFLFMRDRKMLSLELGKKCPSDAFYSGFYVERPDDGKLCIKRDLVQSRSGAKCEVRRIHQLVPEKAEK